MEEKMNGDQLKLLSQMMGAEGSDALQMIERIERMRRLFGSAEEQKPQDIQVKEAVPSESPFGATQGEKILFSAIPFLDMEFQKNIFVIARFMELKRVLEGSQMEMRERQEDPVSRRHNMLRAIKPFLAAEEKNRIETMLKIMEMRKIMEHKEGQE